MKIRLSLEKKYFPFILAIAIAPVLRRIQLEVFPYDSDEAMNTFLGETEVETIGIGYGSDQA